LAIREGDCLHFLLLLLFVIVIDFIDEFGGRRPPLQYRRGSSLALSFSANERLKSMAKKMRAVEVSRAGGPLELIERDIPEPQAGWVRIKVDACGVCHSDSLIKEGLWPGIQYPRVPGHEVIGVVDAVGEDVKPWKTGQRVGVGWHGGNCGYCDHCRRGEFFACEVALLTTGISFDGGYAEYMIAPAQALAHVPDELSAIDGAPLMCAGVTTFNALRNSGARGGDVVAVLGIGGLGHLGVQFAARMGFQTVAIARGKDKETFAKKLGAHHYIDSQASDPAAELNKLSGAKVVIATVTNADAMAAVLGGLAPNGVLMVIGAAGPLSVDPVLLITGQRSVKGWYSGTSIDSQDTLKFSASNGVQSMNEIFPLDRAAEAYDRMMSGKARFRAVLQIGPKR
jgi:D-arabinose 1-dehydrogenase-like Zn-dependent alcohol dehydrogenase